MSIINLTNQNFEEEVLNSDKPVLVDFWANWCGPCRTLGPIVDEVADELGSIKVGKVNVDDARDIAIKYNIMSIPTLIVFKNGEPVKNSVGVISKTQIIDLMN